MFLAERSLRAKDCATDPNSEGGSSAPEPPTIRSDATALGRSHAVVRDRSHVADRSDGEANRLQRAQRALTARTRTLDLDLEGPHAVLGSFLARIVGSHLGRVRRGLAATLEAHHAGAGPADCIALGVGDRDHRVVEA